MSILIITPLPLPALAFGHEMCKDNRCRTCSDTHMALSRYIDQRVYAYHTRMTDVLGHYRAWLEKEQGLFLETEFGWADKRYFEHENVHGFIVWFNDLCADPDNANDPSMQIAVMEASK